MPDIHKSDHIFQEIINGNYQDYLDTSNFKKFLSEFLLENTSCSENSLECWLHTAKPIVRIMAFEDLANKNQLSYVLDYLKEYVELNNKILSVKITKSLLEFCSDFISLYSKKTNQNNSVYTVGYERSTNSFFDLLENLSSVTNITDIQEKTPDFIYLVTLSNAMLKKLIKLTPATIDENLSANQTNTYPYSLAKPLTSLFGALGNLVGELREKAGKKDEYDFIQMAVELANLTNKIVTADELGNAHYNFLKGFYHDYDDIEGACQAIFNSDNCYPSDPKTTVIFERIRLDESVTTNTTQNATTSAPLLATTTTTSIPLALNTTLAPAIFNQTTPESLVVTLSPVTNSTTNTTLTPYSWQNVTQLANNNLTAVEIFEPVNEPNYFSLTSKFGTAIGLGALAGFLNGTSQVILHIAERKNCSIATRRLLAVTLAIANSFTISTLPLIYSIVQDLANEQNDSLVNSQKLLTSTYAFITSLALHGMSNGINFVLPKKSILKNLINFLPLFASLWMLANGEESLIEGLTILGANLVTSMVVSTAIQERKKAYPLLFSPSKKNSYLKTTNENYFAMNETKFPFENNDLNNVLSDNKASNQDEEIGKFFQENKFITEENVEKIKNYLDLIIESTKILSEKMVIEVLKKQLNEIIDNPMFQNGAGLKYDKLDLFNFISLNALSLEEKRSAVLSKLPKTSEILKSTLQNISKSLVESTSIQASLTCILAKIEGPNPENLTEEIKDLINSIKQNIGFIVSTIKPALTNTSNPSNLFRTQKITPSNSSYRNTIHTDSENSSDGNRASSSSEEDSSVSLTDSSKDNESVQIMRHFTK